MSFPTNCKLMNRWLRGSVGKAAPCFSQPHTRTAPLASLAPHSVLTLEADTSRPNDSLARHNLGTKAHSSAPQTPAQPPSVATAAVSAMIHEGNEVAVMELSSEMSRLMEELDAELDSLLSTPPPSSPATTSQLPPTPATPASPGPAGASQPSPHPHTGLSALELSAASPRHPLSSANSATASTSGTVAALASRQPTQFGLPPAAPAPLLALHPVKRDSAAGGPLAVAGAGGRAQRRRKNWKRQAATDAAARPQSEDKFVANGKNSLSLLMAGFTKDYLMSAEEEARMAAAAADYLQLSKLSDMLGGVLRRKPSMAELAESLGCDSRSLAVRIEAGGRARAYLAQKNYRLVVSIAKQMIRYRADIGTASLPSQAAGTQVLEDCISAGMDGLMHAVTKYRPESGCRLGTYATWWIRQFIVRFMQQHGSALNVPSHVQAEMDKLNSARRRLSKQLRRPPTDEELAAAAEMSAEKVQQLQKTQRAVLLSRSFEAPLSVDSEGTSQAELMSAELDSGDDVYAEGGGSALAVDSEQHYAFELITSTVDDVLSSLDQRDEVLVRDAFGLEQKANAEHVIRKRKPRGKAAGGSGSTEVAAASPAAAGVDDAALLEGNPGEVASVPDGLQVEISRRGATAALRRLQRQSASNPRLAELVDAAMGPGPELPARSSGFAKKS